MFFQQAHREQSIAVTNAVKGLYADVVQNIYIVPPPPPEENQEAIESLHTIVQGMQDMVQPKTSLFSTRHLI